ncbi:hypothetical protein O0L34_g127 [Tuta absoluta]|nr:hypothetical protein O0L34_g127 [Tuta absoluta]
MTKEHKVNWGCPLCCSERAKGDYANSPAANTRGASSYLSQDDQKNITKRRQSKFSHEISFMNNSEDVINTSSIDAKALGADALFYTNELRLFKDTMLNEFKQLKDETKAIREQVKDFSNAIKTLNGRVDELVAALIYWRSGKL